MILVYDVISLNPRSFYKVNVDENVFQGVHRVFDLWLDGLKKANPAYSKKIVVPFSDLFHCGHNPLLHGIDRVTGTILRRSIDEEENARFLLYQGKIQPNRSSDGTVHACRLLTDLQLLTSSNSSILFEKIEKCTGNCNETYPGNIFLRGTISEQGNFVSIEQYLVPIWCLVPVDFRYELYLDDLSMISTYFEETLLVSSSVEDRQEALEICRWILNPSNKIPFKSKTLLDQILRLNRSSPQIDSDLIELLQLLFEHRQFREEFFPLDQRDDYDNLVFLLKSSEQHRFQSSLSRILQGIFQRFSPQTDRIKETIKLIGILAEEQVDRNFLLVLIHQLLSEIFQVDQSMPSISDLTNLLAVLSIFLDAFAPSCRIIAQQIIRQMKISSITTTSSSTITTLLRTVLIPTIVHIYRQLIGEQQNSSKRKLHLHLEFPSWFIGLYQMCLTLLDTFCQSPLPIPFYDTTQQTCQCSLCNEFLLF